MFWDLDFCHWPSFYIINGSFKQFNSDILTQRSSVFNCEDTVLWLSYFCWLDVLLYAVVVESKLIHPYLRELYDASAVGHCLCCITCSLFWGRINEGRGVFLLGRGLFARKQITYSRDQRLPVRYTKDELYV